MSSAPMTPITGDLSTEGGSSVASSPPSSPVSEGTADAEYGTISESMETEENRIKQRMAVNEVKDREEAQERWMRADFSTVNGKKNALDVLIQKSSVYASIMAAKMQRQDQARQAKDDAEKKKIARQEAKAEQVAVSSQRKITRAAAAQSETAEKETPFAQSRKMVTRTKPKTESSDGDITNYLSREELKAKAGGKSVAEALEEVVEEHDGDTRTLGGQALHSRNQPKTVSGGTMRSYQLEGLDWLASLYENGLNGILADEMGLGKTIQTISFLAFLREQKTYGPFLVAAPLSTLSNWVEEFAKWTPGIPTVLYHGTPAQRAEIRSNKLRNENNKDFPVVCTSYEICMNDRKFLSKINWKFIIIDEGHRLKNLNCRLIRELKEYRSANRLLITGTPLQNNLAELWSLLNFLMPEVFDAVANFESFFDFSAVLEKDGHREIMEQEEKKNLVVSLHAILKPFLLRRVKTDVETSLPKKREYILYAPLTTEQKELYREIKQGNSRKYLEAKTFERLMSEAKYSPSSSRSPSLKRKLADGTATPSKSAKSSRASTPASSIRSGRKINKRKSYKELNDTEYFKQLGEDSDGSEALDEEEVKELERAETIALAKKEISQKKLQNPIMQLRLACNSPYNFYWPWPANTPPDSKLTTASGKMLMLDRLVPHLLSSHHKILIFSQFKTQLDILEDWATILHGWNACRIDGAVKQDDRRQQIKDFNTRADFPIFLLSTRAGGQGINLAAADTVILYDSDWNPQQDLQAQDRAHRIGQTKPVIVYRLATKGTVEQTLLEKADGKRRLEKLVIQKGKFKSLTAAAAPAKKGDDIDELQRILEEDDFEGYEGMEGEEILSDKDLETLCDRSESAYVSAEKGMVGDKFRTVVTKGGNGEDLLDGMKGD